MSLSHGSGICKVVTLERAKEKSREGIAICSFAFALQGYLLDCSLWFIFSDAYSGRIWVYRLNWDVSSRGRGSAMVSAKWLSLVFDQQFTVRSFDKTCQNLWFLFIKFIKTLSSGRNAACQFGEGFVDQLTRFRNAHSAAGTDV